MRNKFFDWGWKKEKKIPFPSISVGNLSAGGTGKTPHVLLFNQWISEEKKVYIISRGYGRKTKGMIWANENSTAEIIGDEPYLFLQSNPPPTVIVSEKRQIAVDKLIESKIENAAILLDDAFQHRYVKAGINILLTDFNRPYFTDFVFPVGNLREKIVGAKRADIIIVTKCPENLNEAQKESFKQKINLTKCQLYFSKIEYESFEKYVEFTLPEKIEKIVLVCGIANPEPLIQFLSKKYLLKTVIFPDHHDFTEKDIDHIHENFGKFAGDKTIILTTEKDAARLEKFKLEGKLENYPWCIQKITLTIDRELELKDKLLEYVRTV